MIDRKIVKFDIILLLPMIDRISVYKPNDCPQTNTIERGKIFQ
jgi:hypothetical protein